MKLPKTLSLIYRPETPRTSAIRYTLSFALYFLIFILFTFCDVLETNDPGLTEPASFLDDALLACNRGDFGIAAKTFETVAQLYHQSGASADQIDVIVRLADTYQKMGRIDLAIDHLQHAKVLSLEIPDQMRTGTVLASLGNAYRLRGNENAAIDTLKQAQAIADELLDFSLLADVLNNLGNSYADQHNDDDAIRSYSESAELVKITKNYGLTAKSLTNASKISLRQNNFLATQLNLSKALKFCDKMDDSNDKGMILINIGLIYYELHSRNFNVATRPLSNAHDAMNEAVSIAEKIDDFRLLSFAKGYLGIIYEREKRYKEALVLAKSAIFAAQNTGASDALYLWQWSSGRIHQARGNSTESINAYRQALTTIQSIRDELQGSFSCGDSSFRESVGPVYLQLVDLLLQETATVQEPLEQQSRLREARTLIESLKADDLRDYFEDDCIAESQEKTISLDVISESAVVIYPVILADRLELLLSIPSGLKQVTVDVEARELTNHVRLLRKHLERRGIHEYDIFAKQLYDWLIRPIESELNAAKIDTLVFVPDGPLRTIPMAVLHDGSQFLVEKYAIATTPGLDLTDPQRLQHKEINVLAAGLSKSVQGFNALPHVSSELETIQNLYGGEKLKDHEFVESILESRMQKNLFNIVHIASHGQFNSNSDDTFILTFDDKLTIDRLNQLVGLFKFRDEPLELLTLSACETAAGDDRAALGLAGIAIRAGARSAVGTLWLINDQAASFLVEEFYRQLNDTSISRAVALQNAQRRFIDDPRYNHPYYWSPFLLINNWL